MNRIKKILILLISILLTITLCIMHAMMIAPRKIDVRHETLSSSEIPLSMDGFKIVYFSDLHYNGFVNNERLEHIVELINQQNPDVVLFGGDLFDHPSNRIPDEAHINAAVLYLNSIQADKGKFAVLGNHDLESSFTCEMTEDILYRGGFEVLSNKSLRLRNENSGFIVLTGLESGLLGHPDVVTPFESIKSDDYSIVLCHTPDTALDTESSKVDLFLAGHGHGGQIYFPLIGALYQPVGAQEYYRGTHKLDSMVLDITNGVGTTKADIRFLSNAEIVVYTLESK